MAVGANDFLQDVAGGFGPDERFGMGVVVVASDLLEDSIYIAIIGRPTRMKRCTRTRIFGLLDQ